VPDGQPGFDLGSLPHTAPTVDGGGGPAWGGFSITMPWQHWLTQVFAWSMTLDAIVHAGSSFRVTSVHWPRLIRL
jgi:hypothetical protein